MMIRNEYNFIGILIRQTLNYTHIIYSCSHFSYLFLHPLPNVYCLSMSKVLSSIWT